MSVAPTVSTRWSRGLSIQPVFYVLAILLIFFSMAGPGFLSVSTLLTIAKQGAVLTILSAAMTLVILSEGIDLSVGAVLSLAGVATGLLMLGGAPMVGAIAAGLAVGVGFGLLNGLIIGWLDVPPFVATLGSMGIAQGISLAITSGGTVSGFPAEFQALADADLVLPTAVWWAIAVCAVCYFLLYHTRFGTYVFALGGNREALRLSGVDPAGVQLRLYGLAGLLAGLAGVVLASRTNSAHPTVGIGMEFDAIAAVILGGTSFEDGRGGLLGTLAGVALIAVLRTGLNLVGLWAAWQLAVVGAVVIATIVFDLLIQRSRAASAPAGATAP